MYDKNDPIQGLNYYREGRLVAPYFADNYFGAIEYYINICNMDIIFIKGDNEKIARKSTYGRNELFREESHELHKMRISIHKICVDAGGRGNRKGKYECPINLFNEDIEELIKNAVDLGNWAAIENYDPLEGY